jgi:Carbohydrate-binding module 48 (Isoamylase N-terminal domain)
MTKSVATVAGDPSAYESPSGRLAHAIERGRAPVDVDPAAVDRIVAAIHARPRARPYLLRPRLSPAAAFVIAAVAFAAGSLVSVAVPEPPPVTAADAVPVTFVLMAEDASEVALVGDFNEWRAEDTRLQRHDGGLWSVVVPLRPGRYTYAYLVDGARWQRDPQAPPAAGEDFGRPSSVVLVEHRP